MHSTIAELNWGSYLKMGIAEVVAVLLSVPDEGVPQAAQHLQSVL